MNGPSQPVDRSSTVFGVPGARIASVSAAELVRGFVSDIAKLGDVTKLSDREAIEMFGRGAGIIREISTYVDGTSRVQHTAESLDEVARLTARVNEHLVDYFHEAARFEYFGVMKSAKAGLDLFCKAALAELTREVGTAAVREGSAKVEDKIEDVAEKVAGLLISAGKERIDTKLADRGEWLQENREWLYKEVSEMWRAAGRFFVNEVKVLVLEHKDITQAAMLTDSDQAMSRAREFAQRESQDLKADDALFQQILPHMKAIAARLDEKALFLSMPEDLRRLQAQLTL
jgi:hypothetical protein